MKTNSLIVGYQTGIIEHEDSSVWNANETSGEGIAIEKN